MLHTCGNLRTLAQAVYKVHRGIKTLINLFLLPGVYSNALEVVIEDIWRWWFRLEKTESGPHRLEEPVSLAASRTWTHRAWKSLSRQTAEAWNEIKIIKIANKYGLNLLMKKKKKSRYRGQDWKSNVCCLCAWLAVINTDHCYTNSAQQRSCEVRNQLYVQSFEEC